MAQNTKVMEIPEWMGKYIPLMTDDNFKDKESLLYFIKNTPYIDGTIFRLNTQIELLNKLHDKKLI